MTDETKATSTTAFKLSPVAASVVAALQPVGPAMAQDADDNFQIDEIIVTATKRSMNMQDLAQSISALTEEDIARQGLDSMEDLLKAIPSITLSSSQPGRNKIVFRGLNTGDGEYRTDSSAAVYLDEIPMTSVSQQLSPRLVDIERVEALPGPQGTLFGASSQAGTVRYITKKPDFEEFGGSVDVSFSSTEGGDDSHDLSGHLNIPLGESVAVRVVGYTVEEGGWIDNVLGSSLNGFEDNSALVKKNFNIWEVEGGRLSLAANFSEEWSGLISVVTEESTTRGAWETDPALGDEQISSFHDEFRVDDWTATGLTIKGDLGFAEFTSASAWVNRTVVYEWDNHMYDSYKSTGAYYYDYDSSCYNGYYYLCGLYQLDYILGFYLNDQKQQRFSQELRLVSTTESKLQWMVGMFYEDTTDEWLYSSVTPGLNATPAFAYAQYWAYYYNYYGYGNVYPLPGTDNWWYQEYEREVKQTAVFGEISFDLTENWSALFGARWFQNQRDRYERNTFPQDLPQFGQFATDGVEETIGTTDDTTFKVSTAYRFNDDHMAYLTVSEGFRLGGFNSVRASDAGFVNRVYDPDTVLNYEIGNKSTFMNGRLRVNASAFLMQWDDIQLQRWNDGSLWWQNGTVNGGTAETTGLEVDITGHLTENLRINANFSTGSAEYTEDIVFNGEVDTPKGTPMPYAPDLRYWVGIDYTMQDVLFGGDVWLRWDISGQSESKNNRAWVDDDTGDTVQADSLPAWDVSNATVGWQSESWQVNLRVNNVFDKKYIQYFSSGNNWVTEDWFPAETRFKNFTNYNRPREVSLQIRKDF